MKYTKFEFSATGFLIALILVGMFAATFGYLATDLTTEYELTGVNSLSSYENFGAVNSSVKTIQDNTDIGQQSGALDVIGAYFTSGYSALKISLNSFSLYKSIMDQASEDVPEFAIFSSYLMAIIIIGLFLGIGIAVLVKMRI